MVRTAKYHGKRESPRPYSSPIRSSHKPVRDHYRLSPGERVKYRSGLRAGKNLVRRPYTGIPSYLQDQEDLFESTDYNRHDVLSVMGVADRLIREGIRGTGDQFKDAARLYLLAMKGAGLIGDYDLQRKVYERALNRFSFANIQLTSMAQSGRRRDLSASLGVSPYRKLETLEQSLGILGGGSTRTERLQRYAAVAFFGFSLLTLAAIFSKPLGAVVGTNSQEFFGLIAFIFWIVGFYLFFRRKR